MSKRNRLDAELVRRKLADTRESARSLIEAGKVAVSGMPAQKPASQVATDAPIVVTLSDEPTWVSRGAHKLLGALAEFEPRGLQVEGRIALDAGASTGGFSEVLLSRGVEKIHAVDVGYGQLAWAVQSDPRVVVHDRTNVRNLSREVLGEWVDLAVSDLSFISLVTVLPALDAVCSRGGDMLLMIKPQFEVRRDQVGENGVVRDPELHIEAVSRVVDAAASLGWGTQALAPSPLPGPAGNIEYFCWLRADAAPPNIDDVRDAVARRPR